MKAPKYGLRIGALLFGGVFFAGFGIGWMMPRHSADVDAITSIQDGDGRSIDELREPEMGRVVRLEGRANLASSALRNERLRLLRDYSDSINFHPFGDSLEIDPVCIDLLGMKESEILSLEILLKNFRSRMDEIEKERMEITRNDDQGFSAVISPLEEGSSEFQEEFETAIREVLGDERAALFQEKARSSLMKVFSDFGGLGTKIDLKWNNSLEFRFVQSFSNAEGVEMMRVSHSNTNSLPARYKSLIELKVAGD